jgi:hypothetical protein
MKTWKRWFLVAALAALPGVALAGNAVASGGCWCPFCW